MSLRWNRFEGKDRRVNKEKGVNDCLPDRTCLLEAGQFVTALQTCLRVLSCNRYDQSHRPSGSGLVRRADSSRNGPVIMCIDIIRFFHTVDPGS